MDTLNEASRPAFIIVILNETLLPMLELDRLLVVGEQLFVNPIYVGVTAIILNDLNTRFGTAIYHSQSRNDF